MADEANAERTVESEEPKAPGSRTWLWMILSLVVVGGFLVWLGMASEPTAVPVIVDEDEETESELAEGVVAVPKDSLAENKAAYQGQRIRVSEVEATASLGPAIFWGELGDRTNQVPMLVRLDSAAAEGWQIREGGMYNITGAVERMTDSVAGDWETKGEFTGEGEAMQATFTDYFIQASEIRAARGGSSARSRDDGAGSADNGG
jgi:hypothetical protein